MLQLNYTDLATKADIDNNLVYWANLFKATTWEDFKALAKDNPAIEVGTMIFELNYDNQAKELQPIIDNLENKGIYIILIN